MRFPSLPWPRETRLLRGVFAASLVVLAVSLAGGLVQAIRVLGGPPLADDATLLGRLLFERGDLAGGAEEVRRARLVDPIAYATPPALSYPAPRHPEAERMVARQRERVERNPRDPAAQLDLGRALTLAGALPEAIGALQRARRLDPELPRLHAALGRALLLAGRESEAVPVLRRALGRAPRSAALHEALGLALYRLNRLERASAHFAAAREIAGADRAEPRS